LRATDTNSVVVDNVPNPVIHVGDLDGAAASKPNGWSATVTIAVHDAAHQPVAGVSVSGAWSAGATGTATCTTGTGGTCTVTKNSLSKKVSSVTFKITGLAAQGTTYAPASNHDVDGGSDGTAITVNRP
jgi:hypothetical protein